MLAPRNPSSPPLRQATLVARSLGHDRGGRTVLADVSLTVGPGTRLGVIGPNGTGKSTLLQLLAGILKPDDGSVTLDPPSATVGYLAQEPVFYGWMTARANQLWSRRSSRCPLEKRPSDSRRRTAAGASSTHRRGGR